MDKKMWVEMEENPTYETNKYGFSAYKKNNTYSI